MNLESLCHQLLRPIHSRLSQIISRGRVTAVEGSSLQVQFQAEDTQEGIQRIEPFGFYSNPGEDPEALILFPDGFRSAGIAIALTQKDVKRPRLAPGSASVVARDGTSVIVENGGKVAIQNEKEELISILVGLIDKISSISISIPTVQASLPSPAGAAVGPITIPNGSIGSPSQSDLKKIQERLKTFQKARS